MPRRPRSSARTACATPAPSASGPRKTENTLAKDLTAEFKFNEDGKTLSCNDSEGLLKGIQFLTLDDDEANIAEQAERFCDTWVDKDAAVEISRNDDDSFTVTGTLGDEQNIEFGKCVYDDEKAAIVCEDGVRYTGPFGERTEENTLAKDLTAEFKFNEDGKTLNCNDSEGIFKGYQFMTLDDDEAAQAAAGNIW